MILYDKILWADDMLFIMNRWYMMPYYDYGWWWTSHTLAWSIWFKNSLWLIFLWLCQSKSLLLSGTKPQNSSILGTKLCVVLGFPGDFRPTGHKFWTSCNLPRALGLQKLALGSLCSMSNVESEIAGGPVAHPRYIKKRLAILMILKLNYKKQKWSQEGIWESKSRNPSEFI